jgi:hypothetical protein
MISRRGRGERSEGKRLFVTFNQSWHENVYIKKKPLLQLAEKGFSVCCFDQLKTVQYSVILLDHVYRLSGNG